MCGTISQLGSLVPFFQTTHFPPCNSSLMGLRDKNFCRELSLSIVTQHRKGKQRLFALLVLGTKAMGKELPASCYIVLPSWWQKSHRWCYAESPSLPEGKHLPGWTEVLSKRSLRFIVAEKSVLSNQRAIGENHYFWSCPACLASNVFSYCSIHLLGMLGISRQEVDTEANACCCHRRWVARQEAGLFWPLGGRADLFCCCAVFFLYASINHFHSNETCKYAMCRTHYIKLVCVHLCVFKKIPQPILLNY